MKWKELPEEVQELMLQRQEEQGNIRNPEVFETRLDADDIEGGFYWDESEEGHDFWADIIYNNNLDRLKDTLLKE